MGAEGGGCSESGAGAERGDSRSQLLLGAGPGLGLDINVVTHHNHTLASESFE